MTPESPIAGQSATDAAHGAPALAVLGAAPAFDAPLHVGRPNVGDKAHILGMVEEILDARWLTNNGPRVREFEERVARFCGVKHCVAMTNGTIGLEIMIRAAGLSGEVIVPSFTFVATAHALRWQEITPVFCDIDPETHCLDADRVAELVTSKTTGILAVHCWGRPAVTAELERVAEEHGLPLLFDAAHAFGCAAPAHLDRIGVPRMIGSVGLAECFSFHATKVINCFEGGAVTTNDDELAERMRLMRNFGFQGKDQVGYLGSNGKMSEVCGAMGLASLDAYDGIVAANRAHWERYRDALSAIPGLTVFEHDASRPHNFHYVVVEVDADEAGLTRDELCATLEAENVLARRYFFPGTHRMEPYRSELSGRLCDLPMTERLSDRVMTLPTGATLSEADVDRIAGLIGRAVADAPRVREALASRS